MAKLIKMQNFDVFEFVEVLVFSLVENQFFVCSGHVPLVDGYSQILSLLPGFINPKIELGEKELTFEEDRDKVKFLERQSKLLSCSQDMSNSYSEGISDPERPMHPR